MKYSKKQKIILWILQITVSIILLQTLFFKFRGAEESIQIFSALGIEPWGRILTGILELTTGILLLSWRLSLIGAIISAIIMIGAIISHVLVLGINDLFYLAIGTLMLSLIIIYIRRKEISNLLHPL